MKNMKNILKTLLIVILTMTIGSCKKDIHIEPNENLSIKKGEYTYYDIHGEFISKFIIDDISYHITEDLELDTTYLYQGDISIISDTFEFNIIKNEGLLEELIFVISDIKDDEFTLTPIDYPLGNSRTYRKN